jgi:predicted PurR-regulated permease PerM
LPPGVLSPGVTTDRRYALAGVVVVLAAVAAVLLRGVLATVFFALTVAYVLSPAQRWFDRRLPRYWAAVAATVVGFVGVLAVASPLAVVLYLRFDQLRAAVATLPTTLTLSAFDQELVVDAADLGPPLVDFLEGVALDAAAAAPVLAIKATLFVLVVFAVLLAGERLRAAAMGIVPPGYEGVAEALLDRARSTLFAIYVLQAATAAVTFLVALPTFLLLGYQFPFTLATVAAVLQFLPIVGPSALVLALAAFRLAAGDLPGAALVAVVGLVVVAGLPDPLVRPRLARRTANLPGSLYFVGFAGGLFSLGVVGVVAGPLAVALLAEAVGLLAAEMNGPTDESATEGGERVPANGTDADDPEGDPTGGPEDGPDDPAGDPADAGTGE